MSPDLGRFLQPDPIGFKGDASNLYRYCGNDWANRTDPMGLDGDPGETPQHDPGSIPAIEKQKQELAGPREHTLGERISADEARYQAYAPTANAVERQA